MQNQNHKLSSEQCKALYFDSTVLHEPAYSLFRLSGHQGGRFYYRLDELGETHFYISVTNLIQSTTPTPYGLLNWMMSIGKEAAELFTQERAVYGTFMHIVFTELVIDRRLDLDSLESRLEVYMIDNRINLEHLETWLIDIKKDALSFAEFLIRHKVKPLAVEVVLAHPDGYAGAVDLVCEMQVLEEGYHGEVYKTSNSKNGYKKGDPKKTKDWVEVRAIIDYKSGRKGFYEEHEIQLQAYDNLVEHNFNIKADRLFNFSPKNWRSAPDFNLKDQTDRKSRQKFQHLVQLSKIHQENQIKPVLNISGQLQLDDGYEHNMEWLELSELIKKKNGNIGQNTEAQESAS